MVCMTEALTVTIIQKVWVYVIFICASENKYTTEVNFYMLMLKLFLGHRQMSEYNSSFCEVSTSI